MILVPVKDLRHAKQRLAPVLNQSSRTELARAMLLDVLETIASWKDRPAVSIVSDDGFALELAAKFSYDVIPDDESRGETAAIEMATRVCEDRGAKFSLVIPGDIPLLSVEELNRILDATPAQGSVLVPSADRRGTNAVLRTPAALFPLRFGNDSFVPHLAAAQATGKPCVTLSLPGIALDVDTPSDLRELAESSGKKHSQRLVRGWNLIELPLAANS